ncbi:hypothetical protein MiYa_04410 [Microcystis aeruginosa NIES-2519]|jgi:hypothetical protein|uniref:DUF3854 domain-containing protein n=2 Tax=Microcystis aeruginosa TaxID=1126 RepID=A0A5A5RD25_MICAE|nr:hypothetical protein MiYa_04410 [Microcystis aeruginosa NIES-2519]
MDANPPDYIHRGIDEQGFNMWAFKPDAENWNDEKRREYREQREREKQLERERHARSLSPTERDREIKKILNQLTLSDSDRILLKNRSYLTNERIANFRTVDQWQKLTISVSPGLPGVNFDGGKLNNPVQGILVPIPDHNGLFVGLRLYNPNSKENDTGKYLWLSSRTRGVEPKLQNGELPIAIYWPSQLKHHDQIGICEGLELKPAIAADRLGIPFIGASGGNFAGSKESLLNAIKAIKERLSNPDAVVTLYPDAGSLVNENVTNQYRKLSDILPIQIAYWGHGFDKKIGDIDEIDNIESIELIECSKFLAMGKIPPQSPQLPNLFDWDKWLKFHRFTSKEKINQQYIDIDPPKQGEILIINSPTNTGKSTLLKKWAKNDFADKGIIRIGNRNSLELQFCNESDFYHLQSERDLSDTLLSNPKKRVSFCFPSVSHTNSDHWENTVMFGDEIDGTIQQALFLNKDPDNLDRFKEALELCDRGVFLSGTLYDHHIDYIKALCPSKTFRIVENTYQPQRPKIKLLAGTFKDENPDKINSRDKSPLLDRILSDSEPIMIQSDSKHFLNSLERLIKNTPNTETLLVTSDTLITDKKVRDFIENPNQYIKEHSDKNPTRRLVVLASPTMTSGNDITIKYFKRDYHYYCGNLSSVLISQKIIRIRDIECERYISIPEYITSDDTEKCEYLDQWQNLLIMAQINLLDEPENKAELIKKLTDSLESPHYKEACISKWIRDFERKNYRECVTRLLTMQGYEIELITDKKSESENTKKLKETSEEIKQETSEAICNASDKYIGKDERSIEPETQDDLMAVEKAKIIGQLPSIHYSESWSSELVRLVKYDKPRLIQQLNRRYLLHNPDTLKTLTAKRYHRHGQRVSEGKTTDIWRDKHSLVFLTAIEKIGLKEWVKDAIANNTQFTNSDPAVTEIITKCHSKAISHALGRRPGKDSIKYLSWLLGTLGYELTGKRVRGGEARGERRYSIRESCENPQFLSEIGEAIERRYDKITANCTTLEWAFLEEKVTPKNQTSENDSNPDIPVVLVGPDHPNPLIEVIDSSGPKVYYSEPLNTDDIFLATDYLADAGKDSLLSEFRGCLDCVTRPKWSSFLAVIPTRIRDTLLSLIAAAGQDSLLTEFTDAIAEVF